MKRLTLALAVLLVGAFVAICYAATQQDADNEKAAALSMKETYNKLKNGDFNQGCDCNQFSCEDHTLLQEIAFFFGVVQAMQARLDSCEDLSVQQRAQIQNAINLAKDKLDNEFTGAQAYYETAEVRLGWGDDMVALGNQAYAAQLWDEAAETYRDAELRYNWGTEELDEAWAATHDACELLRYADEELKDNNC